MRTLALLLIALLFTGCASVANKPRVPLGTEASLTILETTDLHSNILSFDYYQLEADPTLGFERVASLIAQARKTYQNTLLLDAGDTIQGTALADYQARVNPVACDHELAIFRAMDSLDYDAATAGNHEFNYGLPFLRQVTGDSAQHCKGPDFPIVLSNVFDASTGEPLFQPWAVLDRSITATTPSGESIDAPIRIGLLGLTPPRIMDWDHHNLAGKVTVMGVVEAVKKYLPLLQAQHPDLVVVLMHGGLSTAPYSPDMENAGRYVAEIPGIDALLLGHSHRVFPGPSYADMPGVDAVRGLVHGVPAVMGGFFGKDLGLVHLHLRFVDGGWVSDVSKAHSEVRPICQDKKCVAPDPSIAPLVAEVHQATIDYVNTPIGHSDFRMSSYFADLGDDSALVAVQAAQRDFVQRWIAENRPDLGDIPVLSAAAAFRTGFAGAEDYTDVAPGALSIRNAADLYFYPNTIAAVQVDAAGLKAWLEKSAGRFNRIDPDSELPQPLVNPRFPGYNFDQIVGGIHYLIDVSKPLGRRIKDLRFHGKPVQAEQTFIVATNNYRANGGGEFPGLDGSNVLMSAETGNREVLIDWIKQHPKLQRSDFGPRSWHFAKLETRAPITVASTSGKLEVAHAAGLEHLRVLAEHSDGTSTYAIDLGAKPSSFPRTPKR